MGLQRRRILASLLYRRHRAKTGRRRWYVRPINRTRGLFGEYHRLVKDMVDLDDERFFQYFRMNSTRFFELVELVKPFLLSNSTHRSPISPEERLAVTLRLLAHGCDQQIVATQFRMGKSTVSGIFKEVCAAIKSALQNTYLPEPSLQTFKSSIRDFWRLWNFPNCLGAIDGKHVSVFCPKKSGSKFFNYKGSFSIILMACVDANYRFTMVDIGGYGSQGDAGTFASSAFGKKIMEGSLPVPSDCPLPGTDIISPHVFVGDEAFPLRTNIMRPFPRAQLDDSKRIFNYRLSRARRIVENAFGILAARWRILLGKINAKEENVDGIIWACVLLHNYLRSNDGSTPSAHRYVPQHFADYENAEGETQPGSWRQERGTLPGFQHGSSNMYSREAANVRENICAYFLTDEGQVPWQETAALAC